MTLTAPAWTDRHVPASSPLAPVGPVDEFSVTDEHPIVTNPATTAATTWRFMACNSRLNIVGPLAPRQTSI